MGGLRFDTPADMPEVMRKLPLLRPSSNTTNERNRQMKRILIFILAIATIVALVSCTTAPAAEANDATGPRFTCEHQQYVGDSRFFIITDTQTGEQYLYIDGSQSVAIIHMEGSQ